MSEKLQRLIREAVEDGNSSLVERVKTELAWHRIDGMPAIPLPSCVSAEAQVINRVLNGCPLSKTHPLNGDDFYSPLHRVVFEAAWAIEEAGNKVTTERVLVLMRLQEMAVSQSVCDDVNWLQTNGSLEPMGTLVANVLEFARRRRMIGWLQSLETELRLGSASVASTKSRIAETLAKGSPIKSSPVASVTKLRSEG